MDFSDLEEKTAAFGQLDTGAGVSDDEFDAAELELRNTSRAFFLKPESSRRRKSSESDGRSMTGKGKGQQREEARGDNQLGSDKRRPAATAKRVFSAPTPLQKADAASHAASQANVIKGTPAGVSAQRRTGRLKRLLLGDPLDTPTAGDTTMRIPESARPAGRSLVRSDSTPATSSTNKRRQQQEATPSRVITTPPKRRRTRAGTVASGSASASASTSTTSRIFEGLAFHYIPDNDIAPARRIRITKAKENGASWTRFPKFATHMVVDKDIRYEEIRHLVEAVAVDSGQPIVVNENYPIDCVQFKAVLNPFQSKYQLVGQPDGKESVPDAQPGHSVATAGGSKDATSSLPLKKPQQRNPMGWDYVPPDATPERTSGGSSQVSHHVGEGATSSQAIVLDIERVVESPLPVQIETEAKADKQGGKQQETAESQRKAPVARIDELSDYISQMQEYKDVPLDDEDDEDDPTSTSATDYHSGSDDDQQRRNKRPRTLRSRANGNGNGSKETNRVEHFACHRAGPQDASSDNPNARTIEVLQKMATYYDQTNDQWRTMAYRRAISTLKRQSVKITTESEALRLPSIGARLAQKIEEIVTTDRLRRLEYAETDPRSGVLRLFLGVYGVGIAQAQQWIAQDFRTLQDLKNKAKLTPNQAVGVKHYDDLNTKIPRREVEALGDTVREAAGAIDPAVELIIGGSYRRGAEQSSDIDFIVTKRETSSVSEIRPFLYQLVHRLTRNGFLVAKLASSRPGTGNGNGSGSGDGDGGSKWHGCCVLPKERHKDICIPDDQNDARPLWRRIDFLLVPESEMGAALIYFTGNDLFNRSLRLLASRRRMRLNQRGLYRDVMRGPGRAKLSEGELVEGRDERRIFEILGVRWREPHERWC